MGSFETPASLEGVWLHEGLAPGDYWLTVIDSKSNQWVHQPVEVLRDQAPLLIQVPLIEIEGTLMRGTEPAPGTLWFGGTNRVRRVRMEVDQDGVFSGFLPEPGEWPLDWIPAQVSGIEIALAPVEIPDRGRASLEIEIPDTQLDGEVVDESGEAVPGAGVSLSHLERRAKGGEVRTDEDGQFSILGLTPGPYAVEAGSAETTSEKVQLALAEGGDAPFLRLVLRDTMQTPGRVHSRGRGIPGARILAWPDLGTAPGVTFLEALSGPDGQFQLRVPAAVGALNFLVVAPGFSVSLGRSAVSSRDVAELDLDPYGGTLVIEAEALKAPAFLVHGGSFLPVDAFARFATESGTRESTGPAASDAVILPNLEQGTYALCTGRTALSSLRTPERALGGECTSGELPPFGELRLPEPDP